MPRVVVVGAGPMGLAAAYQAVKDGFEVDVLEAGSEPGGMAAHFDFGGLSLERFYHFVCRGDQPTFDLLAELGIADKLHWVPTSMGSYFHGRIHRWGNPIDLLRVRRVSLLTMLRYGLFAFVCVRRNRWPALENKSAKEWIIRWCGRRGYDLFWRPLFDLKFFEYSDNISAAWMWRRMRRVGRSRKSIMQEELGYIEGGSKTLIAALVDAIEEGGGRVHLGSAVQQVASRDGRVTGVRTSVRDFSADHVICTVPIPHVASLVPGLPAEWKLRYSSIASVGICCVILKLKRAISRHFWVNISTPEHEVPGIVEFSNLRPLGLSVVYAPYYMPTTNVKFSWPDQRFIDDTFLCLQKLNPALTNDDLLDARVARLRYSQPVCEPGFAAKLPPIQTPIVGLRVADTCFYYPEDRSIAESVHLGRKMARAMAQDSMGIPAEAKSPAVVARAPKLISDR